MGFTRTPAGLVATYRFYDKPVVWVEGPSDIPFYEPVLGEQGCHIKAFDGKENANKLIAGITQHDYPYVVVVDGDYDVLYRKRSVHRRVVMLRRYSCENYLWERPVLERACLNYAKCGEDEDVLQSDFEEAVRAIAEELHDLVVVDVALRRSGKGERGMPNRAEILLDGKRGVVFHQVRVADLCSKGCRALQEEEIREARKFVDEFARSSRLVDIVRGHVAFGLLRRLFIEAVRRKRGKPSSLDNDVLLVLLAMVVWRLVPTDSHKRLKRGLRRAVSEVRSALRRSANSESEQVVGSGSVMT